MRSILFLFSAIVALLCGPVFATPVSCLSGVNYDNLGIIKKVATGAGGATDTLGSATDSSTILDNYVPGPYEQILVRNTFTGTGAATITATVFVDALDSAGGVLTRTAVDTMNAAAGECMSLPMVGGSKYRVKIIGYGSSGFPVYMNRFYVTGRRVINWNKDWR